MLYPSFRGTAAITKPEQPVLYSSVEIPAESAGLSLRVELVDYTFVPAGYLPLRAPTPEREAAWWKAGPE